ncbi:hypothetical protein B0T20DRAFT_420537 [Sordaria brevicollis]|uniref:Uncharacterized protein n=1 Tax=Sordaria brevicollis TaxID=83679 RepID=A0AAE0P2W6_SORBR|nr:hypothetical protein B0T20DRAFT_420537 [Sordaria brevicollis]
MTPCLPVAMDLTTRQPSSRSRSPHSCSSHFSPPSAQVPPDHNPHHSHSQNHNSSVDTEDNGRRSPSPCDNEPPSPLLHSRNHSSGADTNQDVNATQRFSSSGHVSVFQLRLHSTIKHTLVCA